jgi:hypothetical protein
VTKGRQSSTISKTQKLVTDAIDLKTGSIRNLYQWETLDDQIGKITQIFCRFHLSHPEADAERFFNREDQGHMR